MEKIDLSTLSDNDLIEEEKKRKKDHIFFAFFIGLLIGCAVFSTIKYGIRFFTFLPLFFLHAGNKKRLNHEEVKNEIKKRNLV